MADEFLRERSLESEIIAGDTDYGRFPPLNRQKALREILEDHPGIFTYVGGLAVRSGDKVYGPEGDDRTPQSPDLNL